MRKWFLVMAVVALAGCGNEQQAETTDAAPAVPPAPSAVGDTAVPPGVAPADPAAPAPGGEVPPPESLIPCTE
jgi:hypothetical protein